MTQPDSDVVDIGRLGAFSDGVFAIAITLLALDLRVPLPELMNDGSLLVALAHGWPSYLAFAASFSFILVLWMAHYRMFRIINRTDTGLMLLNGLILMGVTVIPFTTQLISSYLLLPQATEAAIIFNLWFFVTALMFTGLWAYATRTDDLTANHRHAPVARIISVTYATGPFLYLVCLLVSFVNVPFSLGLNLLVLVYFALPSGAVSRLTHPLADFPPSL